MDGIADNIALQLGAGGLFGVLILREVFGFLRDKRSSDTDSKIKEVEEDVDELRVAVAKMTATMEQQTKTMDNQTRILEKLSDRIDVVATSVARFFKASTS